MLIKSLSIMSSYVLVLWFMNTRLIRGLNTGRSLWVRVCFRAHFFDRMFNRTGFGVRVKVSVCLRASQAHTLIPCTHVSLGLCPSVRCPQSVRVRAAACLCSHGALQSFSGGVLLAVTPASHLVSSPSGWCATSYAGNWLEELHCGLSLNLT